MCFGVEGRIILPVALKNGYSDATATPLEWVHTVGLGLLVTILSKKQ